MQLFQSNGQGFKGFVGKLGVVVGDALEEVGINVNLGGQRPPPEAVAEYDPPSSPLNNPAVLLLGGAALLFAGIQLGRR